jgi:hypothetical protein
LLADKVEYQRFQAVHIEPELQVESLDHLGLVAGVIWQSAAMRKLL